MDIAAERNGVMSNRKRMPTALIILVLVFLSIQYLPRPLFFLLNQVLIGAALVEFYNLARRKSMFPQTLIGLAMAFIIGLSFYFSIFTLEMAVFVCLVLGGTYSLLSIREVEGLVRFPAAVSVTFFGAVYLGLTMNFFLWLRDDWGPFYIYFMLTVIVIGDTGAYFVGRYFGRCKMAPLASPKKTWEGAAAGIVTACLGGAAAQQLILRDTRLWKAVLFAFLIHLVAQVSDPVESLFKRAAGVKDSSNMLPGHGGFLDRIDSQLFAAPLFYYLLRFIGMR